ncbi:uncharacterized protein LOC107843352 [Capsicum annuum]|uniref:uncharacterized protein LOC107843352 n=1 Tax=Capsicum annuum TaxID=4072 RepID=UPI001FB1900E|nr:uncharacterized protein LOC107843352 [Capsicum annuum]
MILVAEWREWKKIMDRVEGRMEGTESSLCKELDNLIENPSLPNQVPVSGHATHELQGSQTNSCTLGNEASSQLSVNDSLSLGEPNVPPFGDDNVQLEIVDTLVDPSSVEAIVASDSTLSYGSHEDQLACENSDVEHVGQLTMDDPLVVFVVDHASIEGIYDCTNGSIGKRKGILNPCPWTLHPFDPGDHLKYSDEDVFWNDLNVHGIYGLPISFFKPTCCSKKSLCFPLDEQLLFLVSCHTYVDRLVDSFLGGYSGKREFGCM